VAIPHDRSVVLEALAARLDDPRARDTPWRSRRVRHKPVPFRLASIKCRPHPRSCNQLHGFDTGKSTRLASSRGHAPPRQLPHLALETAVKFPVCRIGLVG
jgi:hypothetical protein